MAQEGKTVTLSEQQTEGALRMLQRELDAQSLSALQAWTFRLLSLFGTAFVIMIFVAIIMFFLDGIRPDIVTSLANSAVGSVLGGLSAVLFFCLPIATVLLCVLSSPYLYHVFRQKRLARKLGL